MDAKLGGKTVRYLDVRVVGGATWGYFLQCTHLIPTCLGETYIVDDDDDDVVVVVDDNSCGA
jgi:hypothetical protein